MNVRYPYSVKSMPLLSGTFYVSSSQGDDSYDGSQSTPWRSIAHASRFRYGPNSNVLLKCGDVFTGTFVPHGTSPGFAGGTWITLGQYGSGAKPIIDGNGNTIDCGVFFDRHEIADGWKFEGLKLRNQKLLGIDSERRHPTRRSGLYVDSCDFENITGSGVMTTTEAAPTRFPNVDYDIWFSWGIHTGYTNSVTVTGCSFTDCDAPMALWGCATGRITGCTILRMKRHGINIVSHAGAFYYWNAQYLTETHNSNIEIDNNTVTDVGSNGWVFGTAGIVVHGVSGLSIHDNIVDTVRNVDHGVDMLGVCFESGIDTCTCEDNEFRNLQGAGVLMNHNPNLAIVNTSYSMTGNTFEDICLSNPSGLPWMRQNTNNNDVVSITGNTIDRGASKLFGTAGSGSLTDTPPASPPAQWTFSGNTVT